MIDRNSIWKAATLFASVLIGLSRSFETVAEDPGDHFFESRIRPLLVTHCLECHGEQKQESGLRLDSRDWILKGGDSGPAAIPNKPDVSLILRAVRHSDELKMPPDGKLGPDQIAAVGTWIQQGLPWPETTALPSTSDPLPDANSHWAFQAVRRPEPAAVNDERWCLNQTDTYVLAQLEAAELAPAARAEPSTLIRRASLDLLGLPPTPDEVARFEEDWRRSPQAAWRTLIDRLLNSHHYGQRQARYWLDVARYADNKGYVFFEQKDYPWAWTYRDWVVNSFNKDLPYDKFLLLQLAADHVPEGQPQSRAAMGFLTLGPRFMNNTHDVIDDRIDVVTRGLLGLTVTCARCHDHKFDPVPQQDYYSLYGVFRSSREPTLRPLIQKPPATDEYRSFEKGMRERTEKLDAFIETQRTAMIQSARSRAAEYLLAVHRKRNHPTTENFMLLTDKGAINPAMVNRWEVYLKRAKQAEDPVWSLWHEFSLLPEDDFAARAAQVLEDIPDDDSRNNSLVRGAFPDPPESMEEVAKGYGELLATIDARWQQKTSQDIAAERFSDDEAESIRCVLYDVDSPPMVPRDLGWGFLDLLPDRPTQNEFKKLLGEVEKFSTSTPGAPPRAMVLVDAETPYEPVVFRRGNPNREGDRVPRRFLQVLSDDCRDPFPSGSGRLDVAHAIVDPGNPLTARVFVNRIWQQHFGTGIVETASDFGLRSSPPSHPALLDFLASEFVASGWSVKKLHRLIMTSATYQQSSSVDDATGQRSMQIDSSNRLLWRFPRRRLDFETMRDSQLAVSGSFDAAMGGPPIDILGGYSGRRTLYGFVNRMDLPGLMRTFDFPEPAATSPGRDVTTIPQQALFFLNHDFVAETARRILRRSDVIHLSDLAKLKRIHNILFQRMPNEDELDLAQAFVNRGNDEQQPTRWSYGYGAVDKNSGHVAKFAELTHWTGSYWQGGPKLPDPKLGWLFHDRTGGHPGASEDRCFILRWTAPLSGALTITGRLAHRPEPGNGVHARIISSRDGILGEWKVDQSEAETNIEVRHIEAGQTIDFVVDFQGDITHDEFEWPVVIRQLDSGTVWDSQREFRGARSDPWTDYVHALLMTNEFAFVE